MHERSYLDLSRQRERSELYYIMFRLVPNSKYFENNTCFRLENCTKKRSTEFEITNRSLRVHLMFHHQHTHTTHTSSLAQTTSLVPLNLVCYSFYVFVNRLIVYLRFLDCKLLVTTSNKLLHTQPHLRKFPPPRPDRNQWTVNR